MSSKWVRAIPMYSFHSIIRVPGRQNVDMILESRKTGKEIVSYIRNYLYIGTKTKNYNRFMIRERR